MISINDSFDILTSLFRTKYLARLGYVPSPRVIAYSVTWRCNAGCKICGVRHVDRSLKNAQQELSAADIDKIFKDPLLQRLDLIRFTGGEPFLKDDFIEIVERIAKNTRTKIYYITTNGFYSQRIFELVQHLAPKVKNLVIQVSLDAAGQIHDQIRMTPGLYEKVIDTLQGLKTLRNSYNFNFGINQTITAQSAAYLDEIAALSDRLACSHKIYLAFEAHESDILKGAGLNPQPVLISNPGKAEIKNLYERVEQYYKKAKASEKRQALFSDGKLWRIVEKYIVQGSKNRILRGLSLPNPSCRAMLFYLRLLPNGLIMPCTLKPRPIGSLKQQTFSEIWHSKAAQEMRAEIKRCKGCWVECDIVANIVYSFQMIKEICKQWVCF